MTKLKNSKTQIGTKLKNSSCEKTLKKKLRQKSKTQIVTKLQNANCDKNSKTQIVTKLNNSNYDQTQKLKLLQNFFLNVTKLKYSNCEDLKNQIVLNK